MKKLILTFIMLFTMMSINATSNYTTEFELNKCNDTTYYLITLVCNDTKFVADNSKYDIELNTGKTIELNSIKKCTALNTNKKYIVYYMTKTELSNIIVFGVKSTYQHVGNTVIKTNFKYNEFSKKLILQTNNIIHNMNLIF